MSRWKLLTVAVLAAASWLVRESAATDVCNDGFTIQPEDVVAVVGHMVQMDCRYGDRMVDWEKDGTSILDGGDSDISVLSNGTLQFNAVESDDVGTYECVVQLSFTEFARCSADLRLAESPSITDLTGPGAADSDTRTLSALVTGDPIPNIEWRRNGAPLSLTDPRFSSSSVPEGGGIRVTLNVATVSAADRGIYELVATNGGGTDTESWEVPVNFLEIDSLQKTYNNSTSITFTCTGRVYPREGTTVSWIRGTNQLADQLQTSIEFDESRQHYDIISSVSAALDSCTGSPEVVKCIVTYGLDGSVQERGDTICQLSCSSPPEISVTPINCTAVRVSWQPVGDTVTNYIIHYQLEGSDSMQTAEVNSSTTHVIISGLMEGSDYLFKSSCNSIQGPFSPSVPFTTLSVPPVVTGVSAERLIHSDESFSVKLSWEASPDSSIHGYLIQVAQNSSWGANKSVTGHDTTTYLYPIQCGIVYRFRVAAVNDYSQGQFSDPVQQMCNTDNIPPAQRVKFQSLPGSSSPFQPQATSLTIGFSLDLVDLVESFSVNVIEQDEDFNTKQILNYTIQSSEYGRESVCIGGLTPTARYEVCLHVLYQDNVVGTVCGRTETLNEDTKTEDNCQRPTTRRIESPDDSSDSSPTIPDWGIAVIVVGALLLVALLFCFLGLCFACQSSKSKEVNFGSTSSLQTERDGVVAIRMHNPHPGQRAMSPTRSCLKYNRGHSTTWTDHVDTLRQMETDNGTSV